MTTQQNVGIDLPADNEGTSWHPVLVVGVANAPSAAERFIQAGSRYVGDRNGTGSENRTGVASHTFTVHNTALEPYVSGPEFNRLRNRYYAMRVNTQGHAYLEYCFDGEVYSVALTGRATRHVLPPYHTTADDAGEILYYDGPDDILLTINSLSGETIIIQEGPGKIRFATGNQYVFNIDGHFQTRGPGAVARIYARGDKAILSGDLEASSVEITEFTLDSTLITMDSTLHTMDYDA